MDAHHVPSGASGAESPHAVVGGGGPESVESGSLSAAMRATARRIILVLTALVFAGIALASLVAPDAMAAGLGYTLSNVDARSEFRAVYVGLWLAHSAVCLLAARHVLEPRLGDVAGLLVLGQVVGRVVSVALDGELPSAKILPIAVLEAAGAIAILALRPPSTSPSSTTG